jgi:hypothetical protein
VQPFVVCTGDRADPKILDLLAGTVLPAIR